MIGYFHFSNTGGKRGIGLGNRLAPLAGWVLRPIFFDGLLLENPLQFPTVLALIRDNGFFQEIRGGIPRMIFQYSV